MEQFLYLLFSLGRNLLFWLTVMSLASVALLYSRFWRLGRRIITLCGLLVMVSVFSPIGLRTLANLENRFPKLQTVPPEVTGAILLGGSFDLVASTARDEPCYNIAAGRLLAFGQLMRRAPHLKFVFTGGGAKDSDCLAEAILARQVFSELGFDTQRMVFEGKSRNTYENALFTYHLLKPKKDDVFLLVTSACHMPRAMGLFQKMGFRVIACPIDYHTLPSDRDLWINIDMGRGIKAWIAAFHEWGGLFKSYFLGQTDRLYPRP